MENEIVLRISREMGANVFLLCAYRNRMSLGTLTGYLNPRSGVIKAYPRRLHPGMVRGDELPIVRRFDELLWER